MEELTYHVPVLLNESIEGMNLQPEGIYVDVTFGGGGHSKEILRQGDSSIRLFSFDQDEDAEQNIVNDNRFTFVRSNFRYLYNFLRYHGVEKVDAILADLGVSSHHFDDSERGFSFRFDGKLDMRMNKRAGMTAADVVNTYDEERLADIFYLYGELKNSRKLAHNNQICFVLSLCKHLFNLLFNVCKVYGFCLFICLCICLFICHCYCSFPTPL